MPILIAGSSTASPIEVGFRAIVTSIIPAVSGSTAGNFGTVDVGTEISGTYLFESSRVESYPQFEQEGFYDELSAPFGMEFGIGENHFESYLPSGGGVLDSFRLRTVVYDDDGWWYGSRPPAPTDQLSILAYFRDLSGRRATAALYFVDPTGAAFSGVALPATAPDLAVFTTAELQLSHPDGSRAVVARITSTTLIPEPSTGLLFASGIALLAMKRRKPD